MGRGLWMWCWWAEGERRFVTVLLLCFEGEDGLTGTHESLSRRELRAWMGYSAKVSSGFRVRNWMMSHAVR